MADNTAIVFISQMILVFFVGLPMAMLSWFILVKNWDAIYIRKRKRILLATLLTLLTLIIFISDVVEYLSVFFHHDTVTNATTKIFLASQLMIFWLLLIRFWLYFYDCYIITFNKTKDWRMAIDPKLDLKSNWYVKNINRWGNEIYLLKSIIIVSILQVGLQFGVMHILYSLGNPKAGDLAYNIIFTFNYLLTLIPAMYVFYNIKYQTTATLVIDDSLGISKDLFALTVFVIIIAIFATTLRITSLYYDNDWIDFIRSYYYLFNGFVLQYLVGIYPKQLFDNYSNNLESNKNKKHKKNKKYKKTTIDINTSDDKDLNESLILNMGGMDQITWKDIVCISEGYEAVMNHLEKEFSMETLLFVHEVCTANLHGRAKNVVDVGRGGVEQLRFGLKAYDAVWEVKNSKFQSLRDYVFGSPLIQCLCCLS